MPVLCGHHGTHALQRRHCQGAPVLRNGIGGTVVSSTANSTTAGSGSTVTAGTGTTGTFNASAGTTYYLTEAGTDGANLHPRVAITPGGVAVWAYFDMMANDDIAVETRAPDGSSTLGETPQPNAVSAAPRRPSSAAARLPRAASLPAH